MANISRWTKTYSAVIYHLFPSSLYMSIKNRSYCFNPFRQEYGFLEKHLLFVRPVLLHISDSFHLSDQ